MLPRLQGAAVTHGSGLAGYAVVDVEATGSSSRRHRVIELAVVQLDRDLRVQGEFSTLVDPEGPVGPTHIHGIEPDDLRTAPRFAGIAARLLGLLRGRVLVGHNVGCDRAFLAAEYARLGVELPSMPQACTMRLAERHARSPRGLSLRACAEDAGLPGWPQHTALGDARTCGRLFARYAPGIEAELAEAAAVEWPRLPHMTGAEAPWIGRQGRSRALEENVPGPRMVSFAGNGGA
ncbi:3'-5' exonuclease [Streptomyces silvisoli]|uniref:3'-5' exonuclease n=1 Tax=Streptomyces silvisoli TaxID=3034235 RepID=A0ABT5ZTH4_9ACTN|nr:3'-5' exonuclease [Streptomyces silvisoli]MDF3293116.1 3'-5' exonuclease [Streptomyces silvisoli]